MHVYRILFNEFGKNKIENEMKIRFFGQAQKSRPLNGILLVLNIRHQTK